MEGSHLGAIIKPCRFCSRRRSAQPIKDWFRLGRLADGRLKDLGALESSFGARIAQGQNFRDPVGRCFGRTALCRPCVRIWGRNELVNLPVRTG